MGSPKYQYRRPKDILIISIVVLEKKISENKNFEAKKVYFMENGHTLKYKVYFWYFKV